MSHRRQLCQRCIAVTAATLCSAGVRWSINTSARQSGRIRLSSRASLRSKLETACGRQAHGLHRRTSYKASPVCGPRQIEELKKQIPARLLLGTHAPGRFAIPLRVFAFGPEEKPFPLSFYFTDSAASLEGINWDRVLLLDVSYALMLKTWSDMS